MEFQTGGFPDNLFFTQPGKEQPILVDSSKKLIPSMQEPVIKSIRKAVSQVIKEHIYG